MHRGEVRKPRQPDIGVFSCYGATGKPLLPRIEGQKGEYTRRNVIGKPRQQRKVGIWVLVLLTERDVFVYFM